MQTVGVPEVDLAMLGALLQRLSCQHHLCAVASAQRTDGVRISACRDSCDGSDPASWQFSWWCLQHAGLATCSDDCRQLHEEHWHQSSCRLQWLGKLTCLHSPGTCCSSHSACSPTSGSSLRTLACLRKGGTALRSARGLDSSTGGQLAAQTYLLSFRKPGTVQVTT